MAANLNDGVDWSFKLEVFAVLQKSYLTYFTIITSLKPVSFTQSNEEKCVTPNTVITVIQMPSYLL